MMRIAVSITQKKNGPEIFSGPFLFRIQLAYSADLVLFLS
jgi:hypothetical protein